MRACEASKPLGKEHRTCAQLAAVCGLVLVSLVSACVRMPSPHTLSRDYGFRSVPTDAPTANCKPPKYDDVTHGGHLFKLYCGSCHNARALGERPFNNVEVSFAHMRRHAYLTGKEYRQLIHFLRRWHDLGPPTLETPPKRFMFSQPISELREQEVPTPSLAE